MIPLLKDDLPYKPFRGVRKIDPFKPLKHPPIDLGRKRARSALKAQIVPDLVRSMRTFHMQTAAQGVQYYQAQGEVFQPGDPVVTLVDGSPNRKVTNVRLGGNITYVQGPGVQAIIEAVQAAYLMLTEQARYFRETGQYIGGFVVLINGDTEVQPSELDRYADRIDIVQIINVRPYSGKIERIHEPFYTVWKALRQFKYTERASIRLTIGANPEHQREKGGNIAMPILTFAPLGRSPSRGPNRRNFYG